MPSTSARHRALRAIIGERLVSSQSELVDLLGRRGFDVTQATVSRDLQAVGAVKARDATGSLRYVIAAELNGGDESSLALARTLSDYADSIQVSGNLVIVKTPPGAAHVVALAIDSHGIDGALGTVAGDDTMLVVADETIGGSAVAAQLEQMGAGG